MKIALITPAGRDMRNGNRNTATRWARFLRDAGHRVSVQTQWDGKPAEWMLALHARRSHDSISRFAQAFPDRPLIVTMTGTDLYQDVRVDPSAKESLRLATRLIVLQEEGIHALPKRFRDKAHVVYQSATPAPRTLPLRNCFEILVIGHLRDVKDPLRAALALKHVPDSSRIRIHHIGRALDDSLGKQAERLMREDPRYGWLGERPHWQVRKFLSRAKLMVISSQMEGGANVVAEAITARCPVLASRVPGNVGMLGLDYAGYFPFGNERALGAMMSRAETDASFYKTLKQQCGARRSYFTPKSERVALLRAINF